MTDRTTDRIVLGDNNIYPPRLNGGGVLLIDAGLDYRSAGGDTSWDALVAQADAIGSAPSDVRAVVITPAHIDHARLAPPPSEPGAGAPRRRRAHYRFDQVPGHYAFRVDRHGPRLASWCVDHRNRKIHPPPSRRRRPSGYELASHRRGRDGSSSGWIPLGGMGKRQLARVFG